MTVRIEDGRNFFYQWDINQRLIVEAPAGAQVHFANPFATDDALVVDTYEQDGVVYADVPDSMLQHACSLGVYVWLTDHTAHRFALRVESREKPEGYVYTPDEQKTWDELEARIKELEKSGGVSDARLAAILQEYLDEHPIEETDPTVPDWAKAESKPTYTAEEVGALPADTKIPVVPSKVSAFENDAGYQTAEDVTAAINTALGVIENGTY